MKIVMKIVLGMMFSFALNGFASANEDPKWVAGTPDDFASEMSKGSKGLTDKCDVNHSFQFMYQPRLARLIKDKRLSSSNKIRMLEFGLGCAPGSGGMISGQPGGSAFGWRHLFNQVPGIEFELYSFEYDKNCAEKWAREHPGIANKVHVGDASSEADLHRAYQDSGGQPFDIIVDDASHINWHQIKTLDTMLPYLAKGGAYFVEDTHSSCLAWSVSNA
jgi:hypothetical protein